MASIIGARVQGAVSGIPHGRGCELFARLEFPVFVGVFFALFSDFFLKVSVFCDFFFFFLNFSFFAFFSENFSFFAIF